MQFSLRLWLFIFFASVSGTKADHVFALQGRHRTFVRSARAPNGAREARALPGPGAPGPRGRGTKEDHLLSAPRRFLLARALVKSPMSLGDDILLHFHDDERKTVAR